MSSAKDIFTNNNIDKLKKGFSPDRLNPALSLTHKKSVMFKVITVINISGAGIFSTVVCRPGGNICPGEVSQVTAWITLSFLPCLAYSLITWRCVPVNLILREVCQYFLPAVHVFLFPPTIPWQMFYFHIFSVRFPPFATSPLKEGKIQVWIRFLDYSKLHVQVISPQLGISSFQRVLRRVQP